MATVDDIVKLATELGRKTGKPADKAFNEYKGWLKDKGYNRTNGELSLAGFDCKVIDEFTDEQRVKKKY